MRQSDTVARIGGDEFVILLEAVHEVREADVVALKVKRALARSLTVAGHRVNVTVSIGISFYPRNGEDPDALLKAADYAMYLAKSDGGNRHLICLPDRLQSERGSREHAAVFTPALVDSLAIRLN